MSTGIRDSGRQTLSQVQSSLSGYVRAVVNDGAGIEVELTYGRLRAIRNSPGEAVVMCHGRGGGYCWEAVWSRTRLQSFLQSATPDDPEVRRAPAPEVWPR